MLSVKLFYYQLRDDLARSVNLPMLHFPSAKIRQIFFSSSEHLARSRRKFSLFHIKRLVRAITPTQQPPFVGFNKIQTIPSVRASFFLWVHLSISAKKICFVHCHCSLVFHKESQPRFIVVPNNKLFSWKLTLNFNWRSWLIIENSHFETV